MSRVEAFANGIKIGSSIKALYSESRSRDQGDLRTANSTDQECTAAI